jgi:hypothetical protein
MSLKIEIISTRGNCPIAVSLNDIHPINGHIHSFFNPTICPPTR